jgi:hypothetical protein
MMSCRHARTSRSLQQRPCARISLPVRRRSARLPFSANSIMHQVSSEVIDLQQAMTSFGAPWSSTLQHAASAMGLAAFVLTPKVPQVKPALHTSSRLAWVRFARKGR